MMMEKIVLIFLIFFSASLVLSEETALFADPDNLSIAPIKLTIDGVPQTETYLCIDDPTPYRTIIKITQGSSPVSLEIPITGFEQGTPILVGLGRDSSIKPKNDLTNKLDFAGIIPSEINYSDISSNGVRGVINPTSSIVSIKVTNWTGDYFLIYACQDKDGDEDCANTYVEPNNPEKNEVASLTIESDEEVKKFVIDLSEPPTSCDEVREELTNGWDEWIIWTDAPVIKGCQTVPQCKAQLDLDFLDQVFDKKKN